MGNDIVELFTEKESLKNKITSYDKKWLEESKAKLLKQIDDEKRTNLFMSRMEKQMKKQYQRADISYDKVWRGEIYNKILQRIKCKIIILIK